jgi:glycosyltransferase involved in cell wall biosynthesis
MTKFSVLLAVYHAENPFSLKASLNSIWFDQNLKPAEIVLVKDGPLNSELDEIINDFEKSAPLKVISLSENKGLGNALNIGLKACSHEFVARMDTDDISKPNRFELQINFLNEHPNCFLVGANIDEFESIPGDLNSVKKVPETNEDIKKLLFRRNPFNHPSVVYRKSKVIAVGSYMHQMFFEDYYLWFRLINSGGTYFNFQTPLLFFRVGNNMIGRRRGFKYALHEYKFFRKLYDKNMISSYHFFPFILLRFIIRLFPMKILNFIYFKILRKL